MVVTKQAKEQTSHQIQQLRWEIASAKSQADLTMEIDEFLKADSKRHTIPTSTAPVGSDGSSMSDFSATGKGNLREIFTKVPSSATVTTASANSDYSIGNFSKQSSASARSCTSTKTGKTHSSRNISTRSFDKRSSKVSPRSTMDAMGDDAHDHDNDFHGDFSAGSFTKRSIESSSSSLLSLSVRSRIKSKAVDDNNALLEISPPQPPPSHMEQEDVVVAAAAAAEFFMNGNRPQPPSEISFDLKRKSALSRGRSEQYQLYKLCEKGDFAGILTWMNGKSPETLEQAILTTKGDGGRDSGMTALHMLVSLCSKNSSLSSSSPPIYLVYKFVMAAPDACRIADSAGRLPVHHAIISNADSRIIDLLVKAYPESLLVVDKTGLIPIGNDNNNNNT